MAKWLPYCLAALETGLGIPAAALRHRGAAQQPAAGLIRSTTDHVVVGGWDLCAKPDWRSRRQSNIPKIFHHTYKNASLPWRLGLFRGTWQLIMGKSWSDQFWSDEDNRNLVKEHYPWFLETYDSYDQVISKVDAARIFYLHKYGGVYSDLDIELLKDPWPLLNRDADLVFFYGESPHHDRAGRVKPVEPYELGYVSNALMASVPGHPFWIFLAEKMMYAQKHRPVLTGKSNRSDVMIFWTSGPCILQNALAEYQLKNPRAKVAFFPPRLWAPIRFDGPMEDRCEWIGECVKRYPQAYFVNHWTGTWNHCEVGTCTSDDTRPIVYSLLGVSSKTREPSMGGSPEAYCL